MTDRWAEWKGVQVQVPLPVGEQMPGEAGTAGEGEQVRELWGKLSHLESVLYARKGRKNHLPVS